MGSGYKNLIALTPTDYSVEKSPTGTQIIFNTTCELETTMVRFNIRGSDIFIEFTDSGVVQLQDVSITHRARLVRERMLKLQFKGTDEILATMPMF
jgi:hypothetical protein